MKPDPPDVLRKGALAFLDLRFPDVHVERWLGPGRLGSLPQGPDRMSLLQDWAARTADEFAFDIACDVARHFAGPGPPPVETLPCEEVVIEWNAAPLEP